MMRALRVIARQAVSAYDFRMASRLLHLLTLVALMLMPIAMAAPAAAVPVASSHHMSDHHDEQAPADRDLDRSAQCATACAMMIEDAPEMVQTSGQAGVRCWTISSGPPGLTPAMDPPPPKAA